jgi:hypothetical protein
MALCCIVIALDLFVELSLFGKTSARFFASPRADTRADLELRVNAAGKDIRQARSVL